MRIHYEIEERSVGWYRFRVIEVINYGTWASRIVVNKYRKRKHADNFIAYRTWKPVGNG